MAEKVIGEIRFIETEDGFRIEVKGDKEHMRKMGFGPEGPHMGFGRRFWRGRHGRWQHGPGFGFGPGPWAWWGCWDEAWEEGEPDEKPPKDV